MLIPLEKYVDTKELERLLIKHFPEISEYVREDPGLVHLQMGNLERLANTFIKAGDLDGLARTYEFVADLARHRSEIHPHVLNAIHVSFLEGLNFENRAHGADAKDLLPPVLEEMWEDQMEHNRKFGWFK